MATVFFTPTPGNVQSALNARKAYYNAEVRDQSAHNWLLKKMAIATAKCEGVSLSPAQGGGLAFYKKNKDGKTQKGSSGLYQGSGEVTSVDGGRYIPKAHINTVRVSSDGDFGTIKKADLTFTVYSIAQLNTYMPFLTLGKVVTINYGWSIPSAAAGPPGQFTGYIYNFNYTVNDTGGFDCSCQAMGQGLNPLGGSAKAADTTGDITIKGADEEIFPALTICQIVNGYVQLSSTPEPIVDAVNETYGIGAIKFPTDWAHMPAVQEEEGQEASADKPAQEATAQYYITLEKLVFIINQLYKNASGAKAKIAKDYKFKEITIQCNKDWTKVAIPTLAEFVSANPGECIFPGFANYGEGDGNFPGSKKFTFGDTDAAFTGENGTGDASKIMINVRYINDAFRNLGTVNEKGERSPDMSIAKFLNDIFTMIYKNSAQLFKLTLVINPKKETELVIVDSEFADEKIKPYVISAVDQDGIVRTMSLTAKIPQEMAAQAFIKAQSTLSPGQGLLTGREDKAQEPIPEGLVAVKKKVASDGLTPENATDLEAAIKAELIGKLGAANAPLFPLDFSCTLDGIEGFTFGNAITTNYLPAQYKRDDIAFTVTTVEHIIASGDWTTSLSTVCRFV